MATTTLDLGPVRIVAKGPYSATATYELLNVVSYNGSSWLMKASSYTVGTTPVEGSTWTLLAQRGETGSDATVPAASETVAGKVMLSSSTNSESETLAATPKAVKTTFSKAVSAMAKATNALSAVETAQTTADAALPKAGGTMTGGLVGTTVVANTSVSCPTLILNGWTVTVSS